MASRLDDMTSAEAAMRMQPASGPAAGGDDLDDLFDYDAGMDDVFRDLTPPPAQKETAKDKGGDILGLDEAVEVSKRIRAPKPKLDENRLLSAAGIPKLRQRAKGLKLKGKGHEYSDAARLLQMYQLWLDDLFPKARFLDALAMVEKEGHKRRIQSARMEWINEGKPKNHFEEDPLFGDSSEARQGENHETAPAKLAPIFEKSNTERPRTPPPQDGADDDLYDATPIAIRAAPPSTSTAAPSTSIFGPAKSAQDDEPEDDLDALLAEAEMEGSSGGAGQNVGKSAPEQDFDDEMAAMAEMEGMW